MRADIASHVRPQRSRWRPVRRSTPPQVPARRLGSGDARARRPRGEGRARARVLDGRRSLRRAEDARERRRAAVARRHAGLDGLWQRVGRAVLRSRRSPPTLLTTREAEAGAARRAHAAARAVGAGHRVRSDQRLRPAGFSALARDSVPARVHRHAGADVSLLRDRQQHAPRIHRRPRASAGGRCVSAALRRLDRFLVGSRRS